MKKILSTLVAIIAFSFTVFAQVPQGFNYQAVVRNTAGQLMSNRTITVRISIQLSINSRVMSTPTPMVSSPLLWAKIQLILLTLTGRTVPTISIVNLTLKVVAISHFQPLRKS